MRNKLSAGRIGDQQGALHDEIFNKVSANISAVNKRLDCLSAVVYYPFDLLLTGRSLPAQSICYGRKRRAFQVLGSVYRSDGAIVYSPFKWSSNSLQPQFVYRHGADHLFRMAIAAGYKDRSILKVETAGNAVNYLHSTVSTARECHFRYLGNIFLFPRRRLPPLGLKMTSGRGRE